MTRFRVLMSDNIEKGYNMYMFMHKKYIFAFKLGVCMHVDVCTDTVRHA